MYLLDQEQGRPFRAVILKCLVLSFSLSVPLSGMPESQMYFNFSEVLKLNKIFLIKKKNKAWNSHLKLKHNQKKNTEFKNN